MTTQIRSRSLQTGGIVLEVPQSAVAGRAEQPADPSGIVAMIDVEGAATTGIPRLADGTRGPLFGEERIEIGLGQSELPQSELVGLARLIHCVVVDSGASVRLFAMSRMPSAPLGYGDGPLLWVRQASHVVMRFAEALGVDGSRAVLRSAQGVRISLSHSSIITQKASVVWAA